MWLQKAGEDDDKCQYGSEIDPIMNGKVINIYSAEWTYPYKSGVRTRKVRLNLLTESAEADSLELLLNE
ncbi:23796_t:CDS:2, partial [Dentiscutata erythropus]